MKSTPDYYQIYYNRYKEKYKERYAKSKEKIFREDGQLIDGCYYINYYKDWIYQETNAATIQDAETVPDQSQRKNA